jgi:gamma-glutamyl-gamma-aminobutyrate hydrolase PuuD
MKKKCVLVVNDRGSYYHPFDHIGEFVSNPMILDTEPDEVALVVFTGGEDVSPSIYSEKRNERTYANIDRDIEEQKVFRKALKLDIPIAGICRGAQLICALSGGKLVQHITGHGGDHPMETDTGETIIVSSTHHQMQLPPEDAEILGWASPKRSNCYEGPPGITYTPKYEYEVVYYPKTKAVGMQYHPEYMNRKSPGFKYCGDTIKRLFGVS